ncbi:Phr domain containing protein [Aphelenchoides avenae]|nr:Phr domain containing protein [Aphelenchus avenae]
MGRSYSITAKLALGPVVLATKELTGTISQASDVIPVTFDKPVKIDTAKRYTASVVVTGPSTYCGSDGPSRKRVSTKKGDVVFKFLESELSSYTSVHLGQIPQILFRV